MALIFRSPHARRELALTIDDFPSSGRDAPDSGTMVLLDRLQELAIPATFFVLGEQLRQHPGMAARAVTEGHELGNHMWRDQWSFILSREAFLTQLQDTAIAIREDLAAGGLTAPLRWFRPSGGWFHPAMLRWVEAQGYSTVLGSLWPLDVYGPPEAFQRWFLTRLAHPGGIIVLHDTPAHNPVTRRTLGAVVPELQARGYRFVTLSMLFRRN